MMSAEEPRSNVTMRAGLSISFGEAAAAGGAAVLGILGLIGLAPESMRSIATIALGVALAMEGAVVTARARKAAPDVRIGGELAAETVAGVAGIVLGILALLGVETTVLTSIATIAFGCGLLFGGGVASRLGHVFRADARVAAGGGEVLVGIGAVTLGILALLGVAPLTLTLIAEIGVGVALLVSGGVLGARLLKS